MADPNDKFDDNIAGRYYVDRSCIDCAACNLTAPDHFMLDEDDGHAFVIKQPTTPEEEELCIEAMEGCPVESIGNDGES